MKSLVIQLFYQAVLLFSAVMAFIYREHLGTRKIYILLPYLFLVFIQETALFIVAQIYPSLPNAIVYNIYQPITVLVFAAIYYGLPILNTDKKWIVGGVILYLVAVMVNFSIFESIFKPSSYFSFVRSFVVTSFGLLFLVRYFNLDNSDEEKFWRPLLWITVGIVTFYPVISLSLSLQRYLSVEKYTFMGLKLYQVIPQLMSIFLYSCFSYAFYLCQKKK